MRVLLAVLTAMASVLSGCIGGAPLSVADDNPASPNADEAITSPAQSVLNLDQASKRTRELIAARAAQDTQGQHQQQDQQKMPGMKNMSGMQPEEENNQSQGDHDH